MVFYMENLPQIIGSRLTNARERAGLSRRALARASGTSPAKIDNLENVTYTNLKHGPCLYSVHRAAQVLNRSMSDLVPTSVKPDVMAFLRCHPGQDEPDTPISVFAEFLDFCDVYSEPKKGNTFLKRAGSESFLVKKSGLTDPVLINSEFSSWSKSRRKKVFNRQHRAWCQVKLSELDFFTEESNVLNKRYTAEFMLGACRARDFDGEPVLVILCELVSEKS